MAVSGAETRDSVTTLAAKPTTEASRCPERRTYSTPTATPTRPEAAHERSRTTATKIHCIPFVYAGSRLPPAHNGVQSGTTGPEYLSNGVSRVRIPPPPLLSVQLSATSRSRQPLAPNWRSGVAVPGPGDVGNERSATDHERAGQVEKVGGHGQVEDPIVETQQQEVPAV
jgi:hypothetical protein